MRKMTVVIGKKEYDAMATNGEGNIVTVWYLHESGQWLVAGEWSMAAYWRVCAKGGVFKV